MTTSPEAARTSAITTADKSDSEGNGATAGAHANRNASKAGVAQGNRHTVVPAPANLPSALRLSPGKAYMEIHKKELEAKCYEDLIPLRSKNSVAHDKFNSADVRQQFFPLFKLLLVHDVKLINEKVDGDTAVVQVVSERKDYRMVESSTSEISLT